MMGPSSFPVICIKGGWIQVYGTDERFRKASRRDLRTDAFNGLFVADAAGQAWVVLCAEKTQDKPVRLLPGPFSPRFFTVHLTYQEGPVPLSLQDLKQRICEAYDLDPYHWEAAGDLDELKRRVQEAETFEELCQLHR